MRGLMIHAVVAIAVLVTGCTPSGNQLAGQGEPWSRAVVSGQGATQVSTPTSTTQSVNWTVVSRVSATATAALLPGRRRCGKPTSRACRTPKKPHRPTTNTEKLLLGRQIDLQVGGDSIFPSCRPDKDSSGMFDRDPGVWVNNLYSSTEYFDNTVLCLRGFNPSSPIKLVLTAGSFTSYTDVRPVDGAPKSSASFAYEDLPAESLFIDGARLPVYPRDYNGEPVDGPPGTLVSGMWRFLPPPVAREALAREGSFTVTATQGNLRASTRQAVARPTTRDSYILYSHRRSPRLIIIGYPEAAEVPIGLYRRANSSAEKATLTKKIDTVTIPYSRVADLPLVDDLRSASPGFYCVSPPVEDETDCASLNIWPDYPGRILVGDRGPRVKAWQKILILAGIIPDRSQNHDGFYGPATLAAVKSYLENEGISNPDGDDALGRHLYDHLTG